MSNSVNSVSDLRETSGAYQQSCVKRARDIQRDHWIRKVYTPCIRIVTERHRVVGVRGSIYVGRSDEGNDCRSTGITAVCSPVRYDLQRTEDSCLRYHTLRYDILRVLYLVPSATVRLSTAPCCCISQNPDVGLVETVLLTPVVDESNRLEDAIPSVAFHESIAYRNYYNIGAPVVPLQQSLLSCNNNWDLLECLGSSLCCTNKKHY